MNDEEIARKLQEEEYCMDVEVAVQLQNQNETERVHDERKSWSDSFKIKKSSEFGLVSPGISPVDPSLETTDPNPDIRELFLNFNAQFFWGMLSSVEVKWSPRMTLCAGVCVYEGHGGLCSVRLSLPLLKLRPRKDLVETLLHEMIHAYLFVTDNDRGPRHIITGSSVNVSLDRDGHGLQFQGHMRRINKATGANISIYHTFHDEVESYQQHWWRCNGPCQSKGPYFGYVKRAMNRAPSSNDFWWAEHQAKCGGTYTKIKEPEGYGQKKGGKKEQEAKSKDIRTFGGKGHVLGSTSTSSSNNKKNNIPTIGTSRNPATIFNANNNNKNKLVVPSKPSSLTSTNSQSSVIVNGILKRGLGNDGNSLFSEIQNTKVLSGVNNSTISGNGKLSSKPEAFSRKNINDDDNDLWISDINNIESVPLSRIMKSKDIKRPIESLTNNKDKLHDIFKTNNKNAFKDRKSTFSFKSKIPRSKPSVCKGSIFYEEMIKNKGKYILDDLDSNDCLWDSPHNTSTVKQEIKCESDVSPLKMKLKEECHMNVKEEKIVPSISPSKIKLEKPSTSKATISNYFSLSNKKGMATNDKNDIKVRDRKRSSDVSFIDDIVAISDSEDSDSDFASSKKNIFCTNSSQRVKSEKKSPSQRTIGNFFSLSSSKQSNKRKSIFSKFKTNISEKSSSSTLKDPNAVKDNKASNKGESFSSKVKSKNNIFTSHVHKGKSRSENSAVDDQLPDLTNVEEYDARSKACISGHKRSSGEAFKSDITHSSDGEDGSESDFSTSKKFKTRGDRDTSHGPGEQSEDDANGSVPEGKVTCPVCYAFIPQEEINIHLDLCLG